MIPSAASVLSQITIHPVVFSSWSVSLGIAVPPSIIDALENATRDDMQELSQGFFRWVLYSAGAVALGCILEGPEILHELFPRLTGWFTWQSDERLHRFERRIKKIAAVGWFLICLGVLGEGVFELLQNKAESQFQTFNDILLADAKRQATEATIQAGSAAASAKIANDAAGEAEEKVRLVSQQADKIGAVLGQAVSLVNARRIDGADKVSVELKKKFKGRKIQLVSYAGDLEAWGLCHQIVEVVKNAEMTPEDICGKAWFTSPLISPLSITAPNWDEEQAIGTLFVANGHLFNTGTIGPNLVIFVGIKSPFIIGETDQTRDAAKRAAAMKKAQPAKKNR